MDDDGRVQHVRSDLDVERSGGRVILSAAIHDGYRHCTTAEQVEQLVHDVMTTLDSGDPRRPLVGGEVAALYFADRPLTAETFSEPPFTWSATHELVVAVNRTTGFGTVRWDTEFVSSNRTTRATRSHWPQSSQRSASSASAGVCGRML
jgi:hypothetical protein